MFANRLTMALMAVCVAMAVTGATVHAEPAPVETGQPLPAWQAGELDIHQINTGRGEATFLVFPDGTNLLIDASGKTVEQAPFTLPTKPDATREPGTWVARYIRRIVSDMTSKIDYALISHFHGDHMGSVTRYSPRASAGDYQLSGITEIAEHLPIGKMLDRAWPDYDYPVPLVSRNMQNYRRFLDWQIAHRGMKVEQFAPGRADQITLLHQPKAYPQFLVRNLMANGVVWTGKGVEARTLFPDLDDIPAEDFPEENKLSIALRISYGQFDYFTGGDLSRKGDDALRAEDAWKKVEILAAQASGPVDAMKANHHGSWDANGAEFLSILQPRVIVIGARADGHPAVNTYRRMQSQAIWPGPRDIFITNVSPATFQTTYGVDKAASTQGHVVIRVAPGGGEYHVFVLDDSDEGMRVKAVFGPYASR